jgi:uncharacterized protein YqjF (DUF2071 family)
VASAGQRRAVFHAAGHRPDPFSNRPWLGRQTWEHLLFAHWSVDPQAMAGVLPHGLELDLFGGRAWLALSPFFLSGLRPRFLPPIPGASRFLETNVRTYVRRGGRRGIYFFSLDATSRLAVTGARILTTCPTGTPADASGSPTDR